VAVQAINTVQNLRFWAQPHEFTLMLNDWPLMFHLRGVASARQFLDILAVLAKDSVGDKHLRDGVNTYTQLPLALSPLLKPSQKFGFTQNRL